MKDRHQHQYIGCFWQDADKVDVYVRIRLTCREGKEQISFAGRTEMGGETRLSGQISNTLPKIEKTAEGLSLSDIEYLKKVWERWHLNDMRAGTPKQEAVVQAALAIYMQTSTRPPTDFYEWSRWVLDLVGCKVDNGYLYGSKWLYEPLPAHVLTGLESRGFEINKNFQPEEE